MINRLNIILALIGLAGVSGIGGAVWHWWPARVYERGYEAGHTVGWDEGASSERSLCNTEALEASNAALQLALDDVSRQEAAARQEAAQITRQRNLAWREYERLKDESQATDRLCLSAPVVDGLFEFHDFLSAGGGESGEGAGKGAVQSGGADGAAGSIEEAI